jgi:peptidoglycan-associated lipoprotein
MTRFPHLFLLLALLIALGGCGKGKNADVELDAARKALAAAKAQHASDCAKEIYAAAEATLAEAQNLAQKKDYEGAKKKAQEAETMANQAKGASPPGCEQPKETADQDADKKAGSDTDANASLKINNIEQVIYFDFNEANIREDSKAVLGQVADMMRKDPGLKVEIEGHTDVRGSTEYNLQLGERRAHAVEKYLVTQGAKSDQISTISYGEERLIDLGETESAHQKNRRAEIKKR